MKNYVSFLLGILMIHWNCCEILIKNLKFIDQTSGVMINCFSDDFARLVNKLFFISALCCILNYILHVLCKKYTNSPMLQSIENIFIYVVFFGVIIFLLFLTSLYIYVLRDMLLGHILSPFAKTLQVSFLDKFGIFILPFVWSVQILSVILALRSLYRNILSL